MDFSIVSRRIYSLALAVVLIGVLPRTSLGSAAVGMHGAEAETFAALHHGDDGRHHSSGDEDKDDDEGQDQDGGKKKDNDHPVQADELHHPVIWQDPGNISKKDLFYGQGGKKGQPVAPFKFLEENHNHTTPKMDVRDARGKKWRVKLGLEARPEVVASRLLWAVGYFANDDYNLAKATIPGIRMQRGRKYIHGEEITDARFARKPGGQHKIAIWKWKSNHFSGTRELNGLRVMMALLNSWDLKDDNNYVYRDEKNDRELFLVSDVGTAFGRTGLHFVNKGSKDDAEAYARSKFITHVTDKDVSFATPSPSWSLLFETLGFGMKQFIRRQQMLWIGDHIPREDVRWVGGLLGQLSHEQIEDAFRAANYPEKDRELFVHELERRIAELKKL